MAGQESAPKIIKLHELWRKPCGGFLLDLNEKDSAFPVHLFQISFSTRRAKKKHISAFPLCVWYRLNRPPEIIWSSLLFRQHSMKSSANSELHIHLLKRVRRFASGSHIGSRLGSEPHPRCPRADAEPRAALPRGPGSRGDAVPLRHEVPEGG